MDISWRPITAADVPEWRRLLDAIEDVDHTAERYDEADLREELADPATGPADRTAAWFGDAMVGFAGVRPRHNVREYARIDAEGGVAPGHRGRGVGTSLVAWIGDRCRQIHRARGLGVDSHIQIVGSLDNHAQAALLESNGFEAVNWSAVMRIVLDDGRDTPAPRWPAGLSVHPYQPRWSAAVRAAHNEAFLDNWGFVPWDPEMWQQWVDGSRALCPDLSWVVIDEAAPDVVVGYVQSDEYEGYEQATGRREAHLAKLGVRRAYRGRGLASALLRHSLREYRAHGFAESALEVDTNNRTGALGVYERVGFELELRTAAYVRVIASPR